MMLMAWQVSVELHTCLNDDVDVDTLKGFASI